MENKETVTSRPSGICEKLFNALHLNPTFRSLRRIGYHSREPVAAAAAMPALLPPVPSSVSKVPTPPTKSSGLEHPGGAAGPCQSGVLEKKASEARPSRIEPESVSVPLKAPSKAEPQAAAIPSKNFTYIEPQAPPPLQFPTERASNAPSKAPAPAPTAAPAPEKIVSKLDSVKTSIENEKPAVAETGRMRTRKNLNVKVDEYINRTRNKIRTSSSAGPSSSKG